MEFNVNGYPLWSTTITFTDFQITESAHRIEITAIDASGNERSTEWILDDVSE
jgi:hypothetical protein